MYLPPCVVGRVCRLFCDWRLAPDLIRREEFLNLLDAQVIGSGKFFSHHSGPKAHFNFRVGIWLALRPAALAVWNRAFLSPGLQPFHEGPAAGSAIGGLPGHALV